MIAAAIHDLLVIGGGINGAGLARDAAGRGLKVLLAEAGDLACGTSSASSKLVHGGLRYLEQYQFRLVAESLAEREVLLAIAPHLVWPLEFVLPHEEHLRPAWMIRAGLFLYDHLGRHVTLPGSERVTLDPGGYGAGLKPQFRSGFTYYDCCVDDARLVVANARSAALHGAEILTRTPVVSARREAGLWRVVLDRAGTRCEVSARAIANVAGPWVMTVLEDALDAGAMPAQVRATDRGVRDRIGAAHTSVGVQLVKGSHIAVPRIHERRHACILQNPDRRVIFLLPFERDFTLIGTTDVPVTLERIGEGISRDEIDYLCAAASRYTARPVAPADVCWSYSGVRALYDDGASDPSAVTRDYHLELDDRAAPLLNVFGGKLTTYRRLAEAALARLERWFPARARWTGREPLPGGDFGGRDFDTLLADLRGRRSGLDRHWLARLLRRHGTLADEVLGEARSEADLGENFGGGLYEIEARHAIEREWARSADDILWRRTRCGVHMSAAERARFGDWMQRRA